MARIPLPGQRNTIPDKVPGADVTNRFAGQEQGAMADLGGVVANLGANLLDARNKAQVEDFAHRAKQDDTIAINAQETLLNASTEAGSNQYTTQMKAFMEKRYKEQQEAAPSEAARRAYTSNVGDLYAHKTVEANDFENKRNIEQLIKNMQISFEKTGKALQQRPDPNDYHSMVMDQNMYIQKQAGDGKLLSRQQADETTVKATNMAARSYFDGLEQKEMYGQGLKDLQVDKNGNGLSEMVDGLTPDQRDTYTKAFLAKQKSKEEIGKEAFKSTMAALKEGVTRNGYVDPFMMSKVQGILATGKFKGDEKSNALDDIRTLQKASGEIQSLTTMSIPEIMKYQTSIDPKGANIVSRGKIADSVDAYKKVVLEKVKTDPAPLMRDSVPQARELYGMSRDGNPGASQAYAKLITDVQNARQVANPRITDVADTQIMGNQFKVAMDTSPASAAKVLDEYTKTWGSYTPTVMAEAEKDKSVPHGMMIASYMQTPQSKLEVINNMVLGDRIVKDYDEKFKGTMSMPLAPLINAKLSSVRSTFMDSTSDEADSNVYKGFKDQMMISTAKKILAGQRTDIAIEQSYHDLVDNNFEVVPVGRSVHMFAKGQGLDSTKIRNFMDYYSTKQGLKELDVHVPSQLPGAPTTEIMAESLVGKVRWVAMKDLKSAVLIKDDANRGPVPVIGANQNIIKFQYKDMMKMTTHIQKEQDKNFKKIIMPNGGP